MNKSAIRQELVRAGHWTRFCAMRNRLESEGVKPNDAYAQAASQLLGKNVDEKEKDLPSLEGEVDADVFTETGAGTPECVGWVAKKMMVKGVRPEQAPSSEAWSMLCWARRNNQNEAQFWGQIYTKLLPSKSQLDQEQRYKDDGRKVLSVIQKLQRENENEVA